MSGGLFSDCCPRPAGVEGAVRVAAASDASSSETVERLSELSGRLRELLGRAAVEQIRKMFTELLISCRSGKCRSPVPEKAFYRIMRPDRQIGHAIRERRSATAFSECRKHASPFSGKTIAANMGTSPEP